MGQRKSQFLPTKEKSYLDLEMPADIEACYLENLEPNGKDFSKSIGIVCDCSSLELVQMRNKFSIHHVTQSSKPYFLRDIALSTRMLKDPNGFRNNPAKVILDYPADKTIIPNISIQFSSSNEIDSIMESVFTSLRRVRGIKRIETKVTSIVEEMILNGIVHTPAGNDASAPRPRIEIYTRNSQLLIVYSDEFGKLDINAVMSNIENRYTEGPRINDPNTNSAGMGLFMIYENSSNFFLHNSKDKKTMFASLIDLDLTPRGNLFKSIHLSEED